ncbi:hypothetical protein PoB_004558600 [Plakobranchus ocellatus]|uniref:Uncharacterized protein n=1 Tax=Plakobranchus ocellatus TaxID=259542 RepID=A0AAV4BJG7_9GAST|nr:hypothetical protein PoB_004558600 [Plakobranchus ocellatus]
MVNNRLTDFCLTVGTGGFYDVRYSSRSGGLFTNSTGCWRKTKYVQARSQDLPLCLMSAGGETRTRDKRIHTVLRVDSLATVPPTSPAKPEET